MHPSMDKLMVVQKLDREVRVLEEAMRLRPQELEEERRKVAASERGVQSVREAIKACRLEIEKGELEIRQKDAEIEKARIALNTAKSNQEYAVFREQIARHEEIRGQIEERVLETLSQLDVLEAQREKAQQDLDGQKRVFARKEAEVGEVVRGLRGQVETLRAQRTEKTAGIDADHLEMYERILAHRGDAALAAVRDSICQGCFMTVTAQDRSRILSGEIVLCKSCGRLLYD